MTAAAVNCIRASYLRVKVLRTATMCLRLRHVTEFTRSLPFDLSGG